MNSQQIRLVFSLCFCVLFAVMNGTMFNVALPSIAEQFRLSPSQVSWVVVAYGMVFAIGSVTYGKLADLYPVRRLVTIGITIFCAGSLAGFFATHYLLVVLFRIVQACGAAAIPALAMIVATKYFPPEQRGQALGFTASTVALGMGIGPILSGLVTQFFGWQYLFLISVLSMCALPFLRRNLPKEQAVGGQFDALGALFLAGSVACLLLGLNLNGWFAVGGVMLFILFLLQIRRSAAPFIQIRMLKNRTYRLLLSMAMLLFFCTTSSLFLLPLLLGHVNGLPAGAIGLVLFPAAMIAALLGSRLGKLSDRYGSATVICVAVPLLCLAFLSLSSVAGAGPLWIALPLIFVNLSFASLQSALASFVSRSLDRREIGVGMGLYNLITFMGTTFGPALCSRFLELDSGHWNPFSSAASASYSNALLLLAIVSISTLAILALVQRSLRQPSSPSLQQQESIST